MELAYSPATASQERKRLIGAVLLALIVAGLLGWLIWTARVAEATRQAAHQLEIRTLNVLQTTDSILKAALESETGQRGYILTRDEGFLAPYETGHRELSLRIEQLQILTRDNPRQQANTSLISTLAKRRIEQIDLTIAKVRDRTIDQFGLVEFMFGGKRTMDELRATVARVAVEENRLSGMRIAAADQAENRATQWRLVLSLFLLLFAVCVASFVTLFRTWRDTREQRRMAAHNLRLAEGQKLLQKIMDSSSDAIFVKNRAGAMAFTNRRYDEIRQRLIEQGETDRLPSAENPLTTSDIEVMAAGKPQTIEVHIVLDSAERTLEIEKLPWLRAGQVVGMIAISRDVTEIKQREAELQEIVDRRTAELRIAVETLKSEMAERETAEEALRHMQRIESLGQLTGGIAHDFNNMLTIVLGSLAMARRRIPEDADPKLAVAIDNAEEGATRAAELTARLLAFARAQPLDAMPVEINDLVRTIVTMLERTLGGNIALHIDLDPAAGWVEIDPPQMESALVNLAVNARDAMPQGGSLSLATRRTGSELQLTVTDTGEGMPEHVKARAFDPFFTTKDVGKGTGLGLSQVHGFIVQSGGTIAIDSKPGEGTSIRITLPATSGPDVNAATENAHSNIVRGEMVLIVEDEPLIRMVAQEALAALGYRTITAGGAAEALAILQARDDIALMLTDVSMPGMDGVTLALAASAANPKLKIIMTTGFDRDNRAGLDWPILRKPYLIDELAQVVGETLVESVA